MACGRAVASPVLPVPAGSGLCSELDTTDAWALHATCVAAPCASVFGSAKAAALRAFSREAADKPRPGHKCRNSPRHKLSEVPTYTQFAQCSKVVNAVQHLNPNRTQLWRCVHLSCAPSKAPAVQQWHSCGCVVHVSCMLYGRLMQATQLQTGFAVSDSLEVRTASSLYSRL